ncbi:MAG: enoyl-CoA hydratase/isomerase family protein [Pseudomonadota bacterium]
MADATEREVTLEKHAGWAEITLNRPERRNAIDGPLGLHLAECLQEASRDASVGAVLLRGAGGAFCSGLDLKAFNAEPRPAWHAEFQTIWRGAHRALFELRPALVVALERYAINGGAALAIAGDFLVMGNNAFLQVGEVQQGMGAPYNLAWLRLRHSAALTARVALLGRRIQGAEAERLGLATESVPDGEVLQRARDLAAALGAYPAGAVAHLKQVSREFDGANADDWFDRAFQAGPAPSASPRAND